MPQGTKIATCCYCGTRAALVLTGETRHELSCSSCGAPLHDMKLMPAAKLAGYETPSATGRPKTSGKKGKRKGATPNPLWEMKGDKGKRKKKKKKSKRGVAWVLDEAFDALEDMFD
mgnify:FL=1